MATADRIDTVETASVKLDELKAEYARIKRMYILAVQTRDNGEQWDGVELYAEQLVDLVMKIRGTERKLASLAAEIALAECALLSAKSRRQVGYYTDTEK